MKSQLTKTQLLLLFILTSLNSIAQNITIPDPVFKQALVNYTPAIDTNNDGEISIQEAALITSLNISGFEKEYQFDPSTGAQVLVEGIYDFTGIEHFTNLITLICDDNDLTSLDVSTLINLEYLDCSGQENGNFNFTGTPFPGGLTSLVLPNSTSLTYLDCSQSFLTSIDVSSYTSLITLDVSANEINNLVLPNTNSLLDIRVYSNQLSTLNLSNFTSLNSIDCNNNNLTSLSLPIATTVKNINCSLNQLNTINVTPYIALEDLSCDSNLLTSIDLSQNVLLERLRLDRNQLTTLDVSSNTELERIKCDYNSITDLNVSFQTKLDYLDCNDNQLTSLNIKNGNNDFLRLNAKNNLNLTLICVDNVANAISDFSNDKDPQAAFSDICSFIPTNSNTITGTVSFDFDANGCDPLDQKSINTQITSTGANTTNSTFTDNNGQYLIYTQEANNTLNFTANLPSYFTVTPTTQNVNFTGSGAAQNVDFCITANAMVNDVKIDILAISESRPGFQTTVRLLYENVGSTILNGDINLTFDDLKEVFMSATFSPVSQTNNSLTWNYTNLQPFEQRYIDVTFEINRPTDPINPVNNGDVLSYSSTINPVSGDANSDDNTATNDVITLGSYDPNDIIALEGNFINDNQVSDFLNYRIRFQNTGTASAINVVVENELDTDLDWSTFQPIAASHDYRINITNQNKVEFIFENINLPDSTTNEPASNGWIFYKIKPVSTFALGDVIENTADIYFDYNPPVTTNTYTTEIKRPTVEPTPKLEVRVFPNPTKRFAKIKVNLKGKVVVFNKYGVKLFKHKLEKGVNKFDFGWLRPGRYYLKIRSKKQIIYKKLIIRKSGNRRNH